MKSSRTIDNVLINLLFGSVLPIVFLILYKTNIISWTTLKILLLAFIVIFIVFPLIYKYSYKLQSKAVFLNFVNLPLNANYEDPASFGLDTARNFYLKTDDNVKLGVWHILPEFLRNKTIETEDYEASLNEGNVIIYNHGNAGSRASSHRVELYKILRKHFHVIAYDYRSYGDSTNVSPSEADVVRDCIFIFKWVANKTLGNKIFIWGHSLGTSISTHSLSILKSDGFKSVGLILESPFNNMKEEISEFPISKYFTFLPWFRYTVIEPMQQNSFLFQTDEYILHIDIPILILHAEDDRVVPYKLGYKLYETALKSRKDTQGSIKMIKFDRKHKYGHKYICRAPELNDIIKSFIKNSTNEVKEKQLI